MTKLMFALIGVVMFALPTTILAELNPRGVVFQSSGTFISDTPQSFGGTCPESGCAGDLVTCAADEEIVIVTGTDNFVEGVCDDAGPTPCAGRVGFLEEDCFDARFPPPLGPGGRDIKLDGLILSARFRGEVITCFDDTATPDAPADCTAPTATIILEGTTLGQNQAWLGGVAPRQNTAELTTTRTRKFTIDGNQRRLPEDRIYTANVTLQPDPTSDNCAEANSAFGLPPGCGFAGTAWSTNRQ